MARPRQWERGEGAAPLLVPDPDVLLDVKEGRISHDEYLEKFIHLVAFRVRRKSMGIQPGELLVVAPTGTGPVRDGDSLLCACGVEKGHPGSSWIILDQDELTVEKAKKLLSSGGP